MKDCAHFICDKYKSCMQLFFQRLWYQISYIVCLWQVLSIWDSIHNNVFSSYLTNGSSKLVCYIKLGWKGLLEKNTPTYFAQMYFIRKMKCREYSPWIIPTGYPQGTLTFILLPLQWLRKTVDNIDTRVQSL
jgi:hypothetical protein